MTSLSLLGLARVDRLFKSCLYLIACYFYLLLICFLMEFKDTACLVENLNNGGIRFVYFSSENELKSKVGFEAALQMSSFYLVCLILYVNFNPSFLFYFSPSLCPISLLFIFCSYSICLFSSSLLFFLAL